MKKKKKKTKESQHMVGFLKERNDPFLCRASVV